jgi:hypothetical protein
MSRATEQIPPNLDEGDDRERDTAALGFPPIGGDDDDGDFLGVRHPTGALWVPSTIRMRCRGTGHS